MTFKKFELKYIIQLNIQVNFGSGYEIFRIPQSGNCEEFSSNKQKRDHQFMACDLNLDLRRSIQEIVKIILVIYCQVNHILHLLLLTCFPKEIATQLMFMSFMWIFLWLSRKHVSYVHGKENYVPILNSILCITNKLSTLSACTRKGPIDVEGLTMLDHRHLIRNMTNLFEYTTPHPNPTTSTVTPWHNSCLRSVW